MKILVIGGGNMGLTFAQSFIRSKIVDHSQMLILEKSNKKAEQLSQLNIGTVIGEPGHYIEDVDLIILAVKPQDIDALFASIKPYIKSNQVILSIMAGVQIERIMNALGTPKVIRAMPNLPSQIGSGMTVFTSSNDVTRIELVTVQNLLNATGKSIYTENEDMIDASTAVSGSGPAYVFYTMKTMIESARNFGFTQSEAELMVFQTFRGAVELLNKYDYSCQEWIDKVTSRGGTTEAALRTFEEQKVGGGIQKGLQSAYQRAKELK